MKTKYFLVIVFGILACVILLDNLNSAYAFGRHHGRSHDSYSSDSGYENLNPNCDPSPTLPVPEPSTALLLGAGILLLSGYVYGRSKIRNKKGGEKL